MNSMTLLEIEQRILETETSYQRNLARSSKPGYDHSLTEWLKKDLDWFREKKKIFHETSERF